MRIDVIGRGAQAKRYLDPRNGLGLTQEHAVGSKPHAMVIASHPKDHVAQLNGCLMLRIPALVEKPLAMNEGELMSIRLICAMGYNTPFLVAHTHLFTDAFERIQRKAKRAKRICVDIGGPRPASHDYSAALDWGPHAYSVGLALNAQSITFGDYKERRATVCLDGEPHELTSHDDEPTPMARQIQTLVKLVNGETDWRADVAFVSEIYQALLGERNESVAS